MLSIKDKVCLVTGGGGSIGSAIVRALLRLGAKKVIALDISENNLFDLLTDEKNVTCEIASITDVEKMDKLFSVYRPEIVFHAAAHKHVPFMEMYPEEAVKNNILGTQNVMNAAEKHGTERFIFISTDKAVKPVNIMGASKRVCEMMVYEKSRKSKTVFAVVRFGNVIGSKGSVVPLFKKQIEKGVVTVTDKDAERYFMTIPQAAELAIKSSGVMQGGEIFVFNMGKSVKILNIAEKMIRESGKEVIIEFTGLRKGDKLSEELFNENEHPMPCEIENVYRAYGGTVRGLDRDIKKLCRQAKQCDREGIRDLLLKITGKDMV